MKTGEVIQYIDVIYGGPSVSVIELCMELANYDLNIDIISSESENPISYKSNKNNYNIIFSKYLTYKNFILS